MVRLGGITRVVFACSALLFFGGCQDDGKSTTSGGGEAGSNDNGSGGGSDVGGSDGGGGAQGNTGGSGTGGDGGATNGEPTYITEASCDELPGTFDGTREDSQYGEVCLTVDWATNPCVVTQVACEGQSIFFEWDPGSYFNVKFYDGASPTSADAGEIFEAPGNSTAPNAVLGMPEGELVLVRVTDADGVKYDIKFRLDGNALTIDYIIMRAI